MTRQRPFGTLAAAAASASWWLTSAGLTRLVTAAAFAGAVAFAAPPAWAVHETGLYEIQDGDTEDSTAVPPAFDGDGTDTYDADTVFHQECNAGTLVEAATTASPSPNQLGELAGACPPAGVSGFMDGDPGEDSDTSPFIEQVFVDDSAQPDVSHHQPSNKDFQTLNLWGCVEKVNVADKNDLREGFFHFVEEPVTGHTVMWAGALRHSNNGNENIGYHLFQNPDVACDPNADLGNGVGQFIGTRTNDDVFIETKFVNGGTTAIVDVFRWVDTDLIPQNGIGGEVLVLQPAFSSTFCSDGAGSGLTHPAPNATLADLCAEVNQEVADGGTGSIFPAWNPDPSASQADDGEGEPLTWSEVAADLTDLIGTGTDVCFARAMIETRTSQSGPANLFDYLLEDVNICGSLIIKKVTEGDGGTFSFDSNLPEDSSSTGVPIANGDFSIPVPTDSMVSVQFFELLPGTYNVDETVPAGWQLKNLVCTSDQTDDSSCDAGAPFAAGQFKGCDANLNVGETITCTFTNEALADIELKKQVVNACTTAALDGGRWNLDIFGTTGTDATSVGHNGSTGTVQVPAGTYSGIETQAVGTASDYLSSVDCVSDGPSVDPGTATGDFTLGAGDTKTCTFTNVRKPKIKIKKVGGGGMAFDLDIDDVTVGEDKTDGQMTGEIAVSIGSHTISETHDNEDTVLATEFNVFITCSNGISGNGPSLSGVTVGSGDLVTCTIYNNPVEAAGACVLPNAQP